MRQIDGLRLAVLPAGDELQDISRGGGGHGFAERIGARRHFHRFPRIEPQFVLAAGVPGDAGILGRSPRVQAGPDAVGGGEVAGQTDPRRHGFQFHLRIFEAVRLQQRNAGRYVVLAEGNAADVVEGREERSGVLPVEYVADQFGTFRDGGTLRVAAHRELNVVTVDEDVVIGP